MKGHVRKIADKLGVEIRDTGVPLSSLQGRLDRLNNVPTKKDRAIPETFLEQFAFPHRFWNDRGFSESTVQAWKLGYDPLSDQAIIPFRNPKRDLLGVIRRRLDDQKPRYIYPKRSAFRKYLYGAWMVRTKKVALVEGPLDVVACWEARVPALGLMGSVLTADQARLLNQMGVHTVVLMTDNDNAGRDCAHQIKGTLSGVNVLVGVYRPYWLGKDPGELRAVQVRKMFHSAEKWVCRPSYLR